MIGQRFGRLVVIADALDCRDGNDRMLCRCDCGESVKVMTSNLQGGKTRSCGCLRSDVNRAMARIRTLCRPQVAAAEPGAMRVRVVRGLARLDWVSTRDLFPAIGIPWLLGMSNKHETAEWRARNAASHALSRCVRAGFVEMRGEIRSREYRITPAGRTWLAKQLARADVGVATEEEAA